MAARPRRILLIFNPAAGGARRARFERVVSALRRMPCTLTFAETKARGHAEALARAAATTSYDVVAACGGDGTINEVINGLTDPDIAVGIVPLGTANVLAREIGLGCDPARIAATLAEGPIRAVRVGRANGRRFTMMAGVGFDAVVVSRVSLWLKKLAGPLAYVWASTLQALRYAYPLHEVTIDGSPYKPTSVVACKGQHYGGPYIAAPEASLHADQFQVLLLHGRGWTSILRYGFALLLGRLSAASGVQVLSARDVTIHGGSEHPVQADGDIVASLPVHITIDPEPLRLVYPA